MAGFTERKQALHDKIAGTLVIYRDPNKKATVWVIVVIIILSVFVLIAVVGIFASIVLVSLNSARSKANDASVKASVSAVIPSAILYLDEQGSLSGFNVKSHITLPECSGQPIVNKSPDGSQMAIFAKLCSGEDKYFCNDLDSNSGEVDASYALSGKTSCPSSGQAMSNIVPQQPAQPDSNITPPPLNSVQITPPQDQRIAGIESQIPRSILDVYGYLESYKYKNATYKGATLEDAGQTIMGKISINDPQCKSDMKLDVSPDGKEFTIHQPSCANPTVSYCFEQGYDATIITVATSFVEKNYKCR